MTAKRKFDIRLSQKDFNMLERNARRCKISKSEYMRQILNGCTPREAPPADYYGMMEELRAVREDLDVIAQIAAATGLIETEMLSQELRNLCQAVKRIVRAVTGEYEEE